MYKFISLFRYPNYEFISDNSISWSAGLHNRYTENSLRGVILDIHFLSQADFLVCTFSSQVSDSRVFLSGQYFLVILGSRSSWGFLFLILLWLGWSFPNIGDSFLLWKYEKISSKIAIKEHWIFSSLQEMVEYMSTDASYWSCLKYLAHSQHLTETASN